MVLEKVKEIYDAGSLSAELFRKDDFVALVSNACVCLKNRHYLSAKDGIEDRIILEKDDFVTVLDAISEWKDVKDSLWGRIPHGHSWCGYLGSEYFAPNSKKGRYIEKDKKIDFEVGNTEKRLKRGGLEFILERFRLEIRRGKQQAVFDGCQLPLINEVFRLYEKRNGIYLLDSKPDGYAEYIDSVGQF